MLILNKCNSRIQRVLYLYAQRYVVKCNGNCLATMFIVLISTATFVCLFQSLSSHSSKIIQHQSITLNHPLGFCSVSLRMLTDKIQGMVSHRFLLAALFALAGRAMPSKTTNGIIPASTTSPKCFLKMVANLKQSEQMNNKY